ncbi:pentatricopeptide repeat-containing protein At1g07590, mitochondrial [Oryza brachyantha]|uniref:pentatricopeptide repeat-containing protein At1g07590, mitochondrial n=1 Tax=Oryza brachyantha TaxID=4533 RepID=UPI001ADD1663|nr:pentatricopeptide repeat-containing protein At1g07590, mitochondrial [Oryza brachyantha]
MLTPLCALLRRRRPPIPAAAAAAATFFTSSGGARIVLPPPPAPAEPRDEPEQEGGSLAQRVERSASVCAAIRGWMADGRAVHRGHIFHAVNRLRRRSLHRTALQVMEWIMRERPYKLSELDYSYLLEFTAKVHGISEAESLFLRIPQEYQNELLYNNLVMACLDLGLIKLAYGYKRKMRELSLPISPYVYNRLIILHSSPGRQKTISKILTQMKADGVTPHTSTYNILLKIKAYEHNIDGVARVFNDMKREKIEPNEITYGILAIAHAVARLYTVSQTYVEAIENSMTGTNWSTLEILLILYGYHRKEKELKMTWDLMQGLPHIRHKSFILAIEAFGKVGSIDQAEEIWGKIKSTRKLKLTEQFNSILSVYCRHGIVDKASAVFKEMRANGCQPNAITYRHLALGCLKAGIVKEALKTMEIAKKEVVSRKVKNSTPWLETTHMLLENFAENGDLLNAKRVFSELNESKYCRNSFVYNSLLKAYVKAKVYEPDLLRAMILRGVMPDAETYSLAGLIEQFKT